MKGSRTQARHRRHNRVRKTVYGTRTRPRLAVFRSNRYISAQIIDDDAGHTLVAASSQETALRPKTLSVGTAAEVGTMLGERASKAGISQVVFDRGGYPFHGRVKALAESARKSGLEF